METVELPDGVVQYRVAGPAKPTAPPVVFVHAFLADNLDAEQTRSWMEPGLSNPDVRRDAVRFLKAAKPSELLDVSTRLKDFDGPVTVVWGADDRAFKPSLGRRLAEAFRNGRFVEVPGARTFVQLDAPDVLAHEIAKAE